MQSTSQTRFLIEVQRDKARIKPDFRAPDLLGAKNDVEQVTGYPHSADVAA